MQFKLLTTIIFSLIFSSAVFAEYDDTALQRLFTDKQQRNDIDALRSGQSRTDETQKKSDTVKVTGYVKRSDGRSVVWVNDKNTLKSTKIDDVIVQPSSVGKNKKVTVSVDGQSKRLKPGETWTVNTEPKK